MEKAEKGRLAAEETAERERIAAKKEADKTRTLAPRRKPKGPGSKQKRTASERRSPAY
jgi:hypothetical protein